MTQLSIESIAATNQCVDVVEFFRITYNDETAKLHVRISFGIFYSLIFLLGILGNSLVIASVLRYPALQTVRNFFIVSLSCSDIVVCLTSLPITPFAFVKKNWLFGSFLCYAFPLFQGMSICISTFTLMAVAVDRYILIIFPTKRPIQRCQAIPMILGIWALAAGVCLPMVLHYKYYYGPDRVLESTTNVEWTWTTTTTNFSHETSPYEDEFISPVYCGYFCEESWPSIRVQKIYGTFVLVLQFLVPLTVIAFCYSHIWIRLARGAKMKLGRTVTAGDDKKRSMNNRQLLTANESTCLRSPNDNGPSGNVATLEARQRAILRRKRRTNRMLIAMVFIFACSWCPQVTVNLLRDIDLLPSFVHNQLYFYSLLCHAIAMTSTVWNPMLYSFMNSTFRTAFSELLPCFGTIQRKLSNRSNDPQMTRKRNLCQPDADSNLGAGNGGHTHNDASMAVTMPNSEMIKTNRRTGIESTRTETLSLLPELDNSCNKSKSIGFDKVNIMNGTRSVVSTDV